MDQFQIEDIENWLLSKHCTMWGGDGWTVTKDDTRRAAATWFVGQINDYQQWRNSTYCPDCNNIELVDALALTLVSVIGKYVPVEEQEQWNELLMQYVQYAQTIRGLEEDE